jgi:hypothetical protein
LRLLFLRIHTGELNCFFTWQSANREGLEDIEVDEFKQGSFRKRSKLVAIGEQVSRTTL